MKKLGKICCYGASAVDFNPFAGQAGIKSLTIGNPAKQAQKPEKQVVIDSFTLKKEVPASLAGIGDTFPLPDIHITDIGKQQNKSVKEAFADILSVFSKETLTAVQNAAQDTFKSGYLLPVNGSYPTLRLLPALVIRAQILCDICSFMLNVTIYALHSFRLLL